MTTNQELNVRDIASQMFDIGDALHCQLDALASNPSAERAADVAANLAGAHRAVLRLREALMNDARNYGDVALS